MAAAIHDPNLESVAAHWQWALDAAARALDADRFVLPPAEVAEEARNLVRERQATSALLRRVAAVHGVQPAPWLPPISVTARSLGLAPRTKACLFDLDGVLTDSDALHAAAWAEALDPVLLSTAHEERLHYVPFDVDADYHAYFDGRPRVEGIQLFLAGRGLRLHHTSVDEIARRKGELVEHGLRSRGVAALTGAHRYLQAAGLARVRRAVVSASATVQPMLELAGLAQLVEVSVDAQTIRVEGLRSRPAPDLLLAACRELEIDPADAVSLTHSGAGIVAARSIGMAVVGVATGAEAEALRHYGAEVVVPSLGSLLDAGLRGG